MNFQFSIFNFRKKGCLLSDFVRVHVYTSIVHHCCCARQTFPHEWLRSLQLRRQHDSDGRPSGPSSTVVVAYPSAQQERATRTLVHDVQANAAGEKKYRQQLSRCLASCGNFFLSLLSRSARQGPLPALPLLGPPSDEPHSISSLICCHVCCSAHKQTTQAPQNVF